MIKLLIKITTLTLFFLFYISSFSSVANEQSLVEFSQHKQWLKLLHYKDTSSHQSYIASQNFFLSTAVESSSLKELQATIDAFYLPIKENKSNDEHALCRFPARLSLIKKEVNLSAYGKLPVIECSQYKAWRQQIKSDSISLIFASGYMSNPASMYGHLLLKFSDGDEHKGNDLLDNSLNYGAIVPNDENPLLYVLRGIFGGYEARFSDQQFFKHKHNYGNIELRDMWEYELALTPEDISLIIEHLWEILPTRLSYYFIDENCAYHFAKLIELVLDEPIISNDSLWALPNSVATAVTKATYNDAALLKDVTFIPSTENILFNYYEQLTFEQKQIAETIIINGFSFTTEEYKALSNVEKKMVVESLFQYINVVKQKDEGYNLLKKSRRNLINERLNLSVGKGIHYSEENENIAPHLARKPSKFSLGLASIEQSKVYTTTGFRMTYFDDLSSSLGVSEFSNLEMVDVEIIADKTKAKILKVDLIDISSLYLPSIPWTNTIASAWSVRAGYEQFNNTCIDCGIYFAEGSFGKSLRIENDALMFAMVGGKAFFGEDDDVIVYAKLGFLTSLSKNLKAKIELNKASNITFSRSYTSSIKLALSYEFSNDWDVRFSLENKEATFMALTLNYYWGF